MLLTQAPFPRHLLNPLYHTDIPSTPPYPHAVPGDVWPTCEFQALRSVSCLRSSGQASHPVKYRASETLCSSQAPQKTWTLTALPLTSMCFRLSRRPSAKRVTTSLWSSSSCLTSWQYWASSAWSLICRAQNHEHGWASPESSVPPHAITQPSPEESQSASGRHGCTAHAARKRCRNSRHLVEKSLRLTDGDCHPPYLTRLKPPSCLLRHPRTCSLGL